LRQILVNLIGNAIKFTDAGHVRLVFHYLPDAGSLHREINGQTWNDSLPAKSGQRYLRCDVIDTGIGMSESQIARIFQPFAQADSSMVRRFGGTGLGLAISSRLAERLGGKVLVSSRLGLGSTFTLIIAVDVPEGATLIKHPDLSVVTGMKNCKQEVERRTPKHCRVLLAEDGPDNQRLIEWVLRKAGFEVKTVENGALAVDAVLDAEEQGQQFDLVLMDMQMPVMDGYTASRELRSRGYAAPIIALTAHAMSGDRDKCLECGCTDYATKPIDRAKLLELLYQYSRELEPVGSS
jgi:CheY-like chemotaxis protein